MSTVTPGAESDSARIDKLEKELAALTKRHRYLGMFSVTFMFLAVIALAGRALAFYQGRLYTEVNGLILRDSNGTARAILDTDDGAVKFGLSDPSGRRRVSMLVNKEGVAGIGVNDEQDHTRVAMGMSEDQPSVYLNDANGKVRVGLTISNEGPMLGLADDSGKSRVELLMAKDSGGLLLFDEKSKRRAELFVDKEAGGVHLYDAEGKKRLVLFTDKNSPMLRFKDANDKDRVELGVVDGPVFQLKDENGKPLLSKP